MAATETMRLVETEYERVLASPDAAGGLESDLVAVFMQAHQTGHFEDRLPMSAEDTLQREMTFRYGRADIVVFHIDGTATVIEAKDGTRGYSHVISGIGQAGLYATQLAMTKGVRKVRRALLWSSTGDLVLDVLIETVCEEAGVVPLSWPSMEKLVACQVATRRVLLGMSCGLEEASAQG